MPLQLLPRKHSWICGYTWCHSICYDVQPTCAHNLHHRSSCWVHVSPIEKIWRWNDSLAILFETIWDYMRLYWDYLLSYPGPSAMSLPSPERTSVVPHPVPLMPSVWSSEPHVSSIAKLWIDKVVLGGAIDAHQSTSTSPQSSTMLLGLVPI